MPVNEPCRACKTLTVPRRPRNLYRIAGYEGGQPRYAMVQAGAPVCLRCSGEWRPGEPLP